MKLMNLDSLKAKDDNGKFIRNYMNLNRNKKNETDQGFVFGDSTTELTLSIKNNLEQLSEQCAEIEESMLRIKELKKEIAALGTTDCPAYDHMLKELKIYFEELVALRSRANTFSNIMHDDVIDLADFLCAKTDLLDQKEVKKMNAECSEKDYGLAVKPVDHGCMGIAFNHLITSKIFEKDKFFFDELTEAIRKNSSEFDYDFDEYRTLILCIEQETTYNKPCVQIRDFDKASFGSLVNAVAWGTCKSDSPLAMNACMTTYSGNKNMTKVFFMTPKFFVEKYLPRFQDLYS